jgi:hypothetical protein
MKKITVLFLFILLVPQIVLAAWWNPFSWFNYWWTNSKSEEVTEKETLKSEVEELRKQIESLEVNRDIFGAENNNQRTQSSKETKVIPNTVPEIREELNQDNQVEKNDNYEAKLQNNTNETSNTTSFKITEIKHDISEDEVIIYWQTTQDSRSRLILNDKEVFESLSGIGKLHKVEISIKDNNEYNYKITAKTIDDKSLEDDTYGSFKSPVQEVIAYFGEIKKDCQIIFVKDFMDNDISDYEISISGSYDNGSLNIISPREDFVTNSDGEIKYCNPITKWRLVGKNLKYSEPQEYEAN